MDWLCRECNYPTRTEGNDEPGKCPNPACKPGDAAQRRALKEWADKREKAVAEKMSGKYSYSPSALREFYERDNPKPTGPFKPANPAWEPFK